VLPALIRKIHAARTAGDSEVVLWGSGQPRREFLYSEDAADACVFLMNLADEEFDRVLAADSDGPPLINIGYGDDQTILELAQLVGEIVGYRGRFTLDRTKPDGMPQKLLSVARMRQFGWKPRVMLKEGIGLAYADYLARATQAAAA
jgi:GDP-L-fucose synthase